MKKNRIIAGLSAIMMGATMMAGAAMSASVATVTGDVTGDDAFWAYYDSNGDGTSEWAPAPMGMDDGNIDGDVASTTINNATTVDFDIKAASYDTDGDGIDDASGYIDALYASYNYATGVGTGNYVDADTVSDLPVDTIIYLKIVVTSGSSSTHSMVMPVKFKIS